MRTFEVRSPSMGRGDMLNTRYTDEKHGGANRSFPLHIDRLPAETQSVAWALVDRDAGDFLHWLVVDVPPGNIEIAEDASRHAMPPGARELYNQAGFEGYQGPDPTPRTGTHVYELVAYALDTPTLEIEDHADLKSFQQAAEQHALATGQDYWIYES